MGILSPREREAVSIHVRWLSTRVYERFGEIRLYRSEIT
jgi:hypothetical protein